MVDNRQLVWPEKAKYKVVCGLLPSDDPKSLLVEGMAIRGDLFYCKFNNFYVMYKFHHEKEKRNPPLRTRQALGSSEFGHIEVCVCVMKLQKIIIKK